MLKNNNNYLSSGVPVQISEMHEFDSNNKIVKRSILLNIKELSAERATEILKELRERIIGTNEISAPEKTETPKQPLMCTCGNVMILRKGRNGYFFGCNSYPECRQTMSADDHKQPKPKIEEVPVVEFEY